MNKFLMTCSIAAAAFVAISPAQAALPACDISDISPTQSPFTTFGSFDCAGFVDGQAFAGSPASVARLQGLLDDLYGAGVKNAGSMTYIKLAGINGAMSQDFSAAPFNTLLNGMTLIGLHYGAGQGSPGNAEKADTSVLYLFDAGVDLKTIYWKYGASSDIVLFSTQPGGSVPEPATWAMMIGGFALAGAAMRRRKAAVSFA